MNNSSLVKSNNSDHGLVKRNDASVQSTETALAKLKEARMLCAPPRARVIFGLDLTSSREANLRKAREATAAMFGAIKGIGTVALKLVYYRGDDECRVSRWHDDPDVLDRYMRELSCEPGKTQIARLLRFVLTENDPVSAVVFVGDHIEDNPDELVAMAPIFGQRGIPVFVFHETSMFDSRASAAKPIFQRLAERSGGAYCEFKSSSGGAVRELLTQVAAFSAGGRAGVRQIEGPNTREAQQLQERLLLGPGSSAKGGNDRR
jgi:hypothetical protein